MLSTMVFNYGAHLNWFPGKTPSWGITEPSLYIFFMYIVKLLSTKVVTMNTPTNNI